MSHQPLALSHAEHQQHEISHDHHVVGHKIVVKGFYLARAAKRDVGGTAEKRKIAYREEFDLAPAPHLLHEQNALAHVLRDLLPAKLREKDPEFRAIATHEIEEHENKLEKKPAKKPVQKSKES